MPSANVVKASLPDTYYHVYNRGINKSEIFYEAEDFNYFEWLMARSLNSEPHNKKDGTEYTWLTPYIDLVAYCLMPNHFHLLIYQKNNQGMQRLLSGVCTAYSMYFNKKYVRRGPLYESTYKAVPIFSDEQLLHTSRYIHLNPNEYRNWVHSSYKDYKSDSQRSWLNTQRILSMFRDKEEYEEFNHNYEELRDDLKKQKLELANKY